MIDEFLRLVDDGAERARAAWITTAPGQAMSYLYKAAEAERLLAAHAAAAAIDPAAYPWCAAEVGITAPATGDDTADMVAVASVLAGNAMAWSVMGAAIEQIRLSAKVAIRTAPNAEAAADIVAALAWPAPPAGAGA